MSTGVIHRCCY